MVKEKLAEDLGLEYCTVTNYFSHCPSSTNAFKHDTGLSGMLILDLEAPLSPVKHATDH